MDGKEKNSTQFILSNAPHIKNSQSLSKIMWTVVIALMPACLFSIYTFGMNPLYLLLGSVISAITAEALFQVWMKKPVTCFDGSAVITGLLVAMNVPPEAPVWMVCIGAFFAIIIVKQLFGGLGFNIFNPALSARAFLMASWPVHMTTDWHKFSYANTLAESVKNISGLPAEAFDAITRATPLAALKEGSRLFTEMNAPLKYLYEIIFSNNMIKQLFIGNVGGNLGETSAVLLLAGGIFLMFKKIITWHIPASFLGTVAVFMFSYYSFNDFPDPSRIALFHLLSGGLMLGAFFMATDMVTTPVTKTGMLIFGTGCGLITSVIRLWGGYPEGISYSILLMNATVPLIDRVIKPRVFGLKKDKYK